MASLTHDSICPTGMYKGRRMADVPKDYLAWCWAHDVIDFRIKKYMKTNMKDFDELINIEVAKKWNKDTAKKK